MNDDLISRAEAIDALDCINGVEEVLRSLPSAQPEMNLDEWCTDCKEYDHEKHCCPRWNRVIRQTLKDAQPELIRCRDCKFWRDQQEGVIGVPICARYEKLPFLFVIGGDGFCSFAERRTDAD